MLGPLYSPLLGFDPAFAVGDRVRSATNKKKKGVIVAIELSSSISKRYSVHWTNGTETKEYADNLERAP